MNNSKIIKVAISGIFILFLPLLANAGIPSSGRSKRVIEKVTPGLEKEFNKKGLKLGSPVFIRIFKESKELEVWGNIKNSKEFKLFRVYEIKCFSGELGPKLKEGDWQAPEGFYDIIENRLNPVSNFHLSFDIGFPNKYDRVNGRTGNEIMVHGSNVSIGCFAMGDKNIEEIYTMVDKALRNGQKLIKVQVFPFRMTKENMEIHKDSSWIDFWNNLKPGYEYFENKHIPPRVIIKNKEYSFEDDQKEEICLLYEPAQVEVSGKIKREVFPGRPNYEDVTKGDEPEYCWILHLASPISVNSKQDDDIDNVSETNIKEIQLVFDKEEYNTYRKLLNQPVVVSGSLFHSHTARHHTKVLIKVKEIKKNMDYIKE